MGTGLRVGTMAYRIANLNQEARAREKQARRDHDEARLRANEVSREELSRENGFFSSLPLHGFRVVSVGGRPLSRAR